MSHYDEAGMTRRKCEGSLINPSLTDVTGGPVSSTQAMGIWISMRNLASISQHPLVPQASQVAQVPTGTTQPLLSLPTAGEYLNKRDNDQLLLPIRCTTDSSIHYPTCINEHMAAQYSDQRGVGSYPELQHTDNNICVSFSPCTVPKLNGGSAKNSSSSSSSSKNEIASLNSAAETAATMTETTGGITPLKPPTSKSKDLDMANSTPYNHINSGLLLSSAELFGSNNECAVTDDLHFNTYNKDQSDESQGLIDEEDDKDPRECRHSFVSQLSLTKSSPSDHTN
ncbi:hypothetical protein ACJ72_03547 [Emergomyces africanus]|uniref:Uncharacterized protein n=1 Tax=Emergomyces africanus TaxID=1955775 RepID=A0A1B7NZ90_9EURO|nr:hypothetical protein ACJ72_03547 [Emergomyces africanus]